LKLVLASGCRVIRVLDGDHLLPVGPDTTGQPGMKVLVTGAQDSLPGVVEYLGRETEKRGLIDLDQQQMEVVVTSAKVTGRTLGEVNPLVNYGVTVQEINRVGQSFVPNDDLILQPMDVLQVSGPSANLKEFAKAAGHRSKALQQTDLLSLATGIALGA